jgi:sugar phosphate permease
MIAEMAQSRRWRRVLPIVFISYSLAFLDRVNFGFATAAGMAADLRITPALSSLIGAVFFLAYFLFQIPGTIYAERRSAKKLIFWSLLAWGGLAALTGLVSNIACLLVIRFLLGMAEAAVLPALLILLSHWFTRAERSRANSILILGNPITVTWMSIISGYLIHSFTWRGMFVLEGIPAMVWAFVWWLWVNDRPADAKWLGAEERTRIEGTLASEQSGLPAMRNYRQAFRTTLVVCLCLLYFCWGFGLYGYILWLPSILRQASHLGMVAMGWLAAVPYVAAAFAMVAISSWSDRKARRKPFVWPFMLLAAVALLGSCVVNSHNFGVSYALLIVVGIGIYAPFGPFFAIMPETLSRNVCGGAIAIVNSMGALGGFLGSFFVGYLNDRTGSPTASYEAMGGFLVVAAILGYLLPDC